ncbi:MAG: hypothetical protein ACRELB_07930, partial [Polyangiaceae bacterium]
TAPAATTPGALAAGATGATARARTDPAPPPLEATAAVVPDVGVAYLEPTPAAVAASASATAAPPPPHLSPPPATTPALAAGGSQTPRDPDAPASFHSDNPY